ncbi:MAG: hypothetical protein PHD67_05655 [Oscillospiraceae bacterium]|nr:hypothetical protein [Oscillospiraceae bacterium]
MENRFLGGKTLDQIRAEGRAHDLANMEIRRKEAEKRQEAEAKERAMEKPPDTAVSIARLLEDLSRVQPGSAYALGQVVAVLRGTLKALENLCIAQQIPKEGGEDNGSRGL